MRIATVRLLGALVIGVATMFVMKPDPRMHWSISPTARVITVAHRRRSPDLLFDRLTLFDADFL